MDCVGDTQLKFCNTSWLLSLEACFINLIQATWFSSVAFCTRSVAVGVAGKATWSGKLSDSYMIAVYVYYKTGRRNCRS